MADETIPVLLRHVRRLGAALAPSRAADRDLLRRFVARRDEGAFEELLRRHGGLVYRVCRRLLPRRQDAEDAFQATFLTLVRKASSIRAQESVGSWLYGVARRQALQARDAASRRCRAHERHQAGAGADPPPGPLGEVALRDAEAALHEELARLPEQYRAPLVLCSLQGARRQEAAARLGWSLATLKRRLERGRELLRARLTRRGLSPPAALAALLLAGPLAAPAAVPSLLADSTLRAARLAAAAAAPAAWAGVPTGIKLAPLLLLAAVAAGAGLLAGRRGPAVNQGRAATAPARPGEPLPPGALARLGTARFRHAGAIFATAFSPDGKWLATGSGDHDNVVRLWEAATGRLLRRLPRHQGQVYTVAFSPDGKLLASAGDGGPGNTNGVVHLWEPATGREVRQLRHPESPVYTVAFSPDGRTLAAGGWDHTARLWDVASGRQVGRLRGHERIVWSFAFSPDGRWLATASEDNTVRVWDAATCREIRRLPGPEKLGRLENTPSVAFAPRGRAAVAGGFGDGTVLVWDGATGKELFRARAAPGLNRVAFSPDGKRLASGASGTLWDWAAGKEVTRLRGHTHWVRSLAFSPDGKTVAADAAGPRLCLWDAATGEELPSPPGHLCSVWSVAFLPDGKRVASAGADGTARLWEAATGRELLRLPRESTTRQAFGLTVAVSPDGLRLASRVKGTLHVWDARGREVARLEEKKGGEGWARSYAFSPDGRLLAVGGDQGDPRIRLFRAATGEEVRRVGEHPGGVNCLAFSADGKRLATGSSDGSIRVWDAATGQRLPAPAGHEGGAGPPHGPGGCVTSVAFSPDGRTLASGGWDGTARLWGAGTGRELFRLTCPETFVHQVAFSPDGRALAACGGGGMIRLWETATGSPRARLGRGAGAVYSVAFSPDGRALASGNSDTTVVVWDVTGLAGPEGALPALRLSPGELEACWAALAGPAGERAHGAIWKLVAAGGQAVPLLKERLRPAGRGPGPEEMARLISGLDSERFDERERAARALEGLGELAEPALRRALEGRPSLEVRRRAERLLRKLDGPVTGPDRLREVRGVEVLERVGSEEARSVLKRLAGGPAAARLTREAKAALGRLGR